MGISPPRRAHEPQRFAKLSFAHSHDENAMGFPAEPAPQESNQPSVRPRGHPRPHRVGEQPQVTVGSQQRDAPITERGAGDVEDDDPRHHAIR
jgi:hypothetical protein